MTEHRKIDPPARPLKPTRSLLERADEAFGLGKLGAAKVPRDLPEIEQRVAEAERRVAAQTPGAKTDAEPAADPASAASAEPVRPVALRGPRQSVDRDRLRAEGLLVPEDPVTGQLEEFRIVKRELLADARAHGDARARRILVCSPHPGEGKTYCATNLAIAMAAERDLEVLLIDADVIKPSVTERFGMKGGPGLMDALADPSAKPETFAIETDIERLFVMPAGTGGARDAEYLASARTGEVLDRLTRGAANRIVILDTPPALSASPAAELAAHVGQAVLVVRADETSRAALDDSSQLLSACPDIKLLLNAAQYSPSGRRFGDYGKGERA